MSHKRNSSTRGSFSKLLVSSLDELSDLEIESCLSDYTFHADSDREDDIYSENTRPGLTKADSPSDRRMYERHDLGIPVIVVSGNRMFRSYTKNISSGGMLLAQKPHKDFVKGDVRIIIQYPDQSLNIEIPAKFADGLTQENRRLDFRKAPRESIRQLNALIEFELRSSAGEAA